MLILAFMPQQWEDRIATITDPRAEAVGQQPTRNVDDALESGYGPAVDRRRIRDLLEARSSRSTTPPTNGSHAAHSIYFQVLGEHGFIALGMFLLFWVLVWRMCSQVAAMTSQPAR